MVRRVSRFSILVFTVRDSVSGAEGAPSPAGKQ